MDRAFLESLPVSLYFNPKEFGRRVVVGIMVEDIEKKLKKEKIPYSISCPFPISTILDFDCSLGDRDKVLSLLHERPSFIYSDKMRYVCSDYIYPQGNPFPLEDFPKRHLSYATGLVQRKACDIYFS